MVHTLERQAAPDIEQMNARVRKMLEGAIQSDGIEELFETGKHISVDIFSDEYMDKINAIQLPNTKIKILQRLLSQAIDEFKKVNKIMGVEFADRLKKVVDEYNNRRRDEAYLLVRRITITANKLVDEKSVKQEDEYQQLDLFTDYEAQRKKQAEEEEKLERERRMQEAMLSIKKKFGKNAVLKGMNLEEGATAKDRNEQIGGHKA